MQPREKGASGSSGERGRGWCVGSCGTIWVVCCGVYRRVSRDLLVDAIFVEMAFRFSWGIGRGQGFSALKRCGLVGGVMGDVSWQCAMCV